MSSEPVTVYLGLGSNLGDREDNLKQALNKLGERLRIEKVSSVYDTEPVGDANQPRYLNLVCEANTTLPPLALLALAKGIESKLGRIGDSGASRPIDIDVLFYGDQVVNAPGLIIPHPRLQERAFVLIPLAEIAPGLVHPVLCRTAKDLLAGVKEKQDVVKLIRS